MTGRPERLFPLFAGLETLPGVGPKTAKLFANMAVASPKDLIFTLPSAGVDRTPVESVRDAALPGVVTVPVTVGRHIPPATRGRPYRIEVEDAKTTFQVVYFRGAADLHARVLPTGQRRILSGKVELYDGIAQMPHPDHVLSE
ncbi:MAG: ATP-dependent DNA helicase RecG, partial [Jannaschia sp.]